MINKTLLLICNHFPYGGGETFIEGEFEYLHKAFKKAIVLTRTNKTEVKYQVPQDVELIRLAPKSDLKRKFRFLSIQFANRKRINELLQNEASSVKSIFGSQANDSQKAKMKHDLFKALELKDFIERKVLPVTGKDIVVYSYWQNASTLSAVLLKEDNLCDLAISRGHGSDVYFEAHKDNYLSFRKYISQNIDGLFFISDFGKKYQSEKLKSQFESYIVSRLGTRITQEPKESGNSDKKVLASCSNIIPLKRIHLIIRALAEIDSTEIHWVHFGNGPMETEVRDLAKEMLSNKKNISYDFKGRVPNDEIHTFYADSQVDLFVNVSESEGVPVSIMEAMSHGIPAVATNVGGTSEIVDDKCGKLVNSDVSPSQLATVLEDELDKKEKGALAYEKWKKYYCAEENYARFINDIKELIDRG